MNVNYELLEDAVVDQLKAKCPALLSVKAVTTAGLFQVDARPAALVICKDARTVDSGSVAAAIRVTERATVTVLLFAGDSGLEAGSARRGPVGGHALRGMAWDALTGFVPNLSDVLAVYPMLPVGWAEFQAETGFFGLAVEFTLDLTTING